jgi:hypothetical protein
VQVVIDMEPEEAVSRVIVITCLTLPLAFFAVLLLSLPVLAFSNKIKIEL